MTETPSTPGEEQDVYVPEDDAIIGRALRWSAAVLVVAGLAVAGLVWALHEEEVLPPPEPAPYVPPKVVAAEVSIPPVLFRDITDEAGLDFVHENGARGDKLLPETMGGGCAFLDVDSDGDPDALLVNARPWTDDVPRVGTKGTRLFENDGRGGFVDASAERGVDLDVYGTGCAVGDVDNDGDPDVLVTALGPDHLLENDAGVFVDVTERAGVAGGDAWSTCAAFADLDADGALDLFVGRYVEWTAEIDRALDYRLTGVGRAYGPPDNFSGTFPALYRGRGDGSFEDVSASAGVRVTNPATGGPVAKSLGVAPCDADGDGDLDLFVANDTVQNFLLLNDGTGRFEEVGAAWGVAFDRNGNATGAMGIDAARHRNDASLSFAIGNFANEMSSLYVGEPGTSLFTDEAIGEGIGAPTRSYLSFGLFFFDYDLDGRLDLLQANGHLEDEINTVQASQHYEQPVQLFWNAGPGSRASFVEVPPEQTGDLGRPIVGRASAYADIDGDGDLDVLITQAGRRAVLLRNDQALGHHWLRVQLEGTRCHRDAIGAWLELAVGDGVLWRRVMPTRSYLAQVERTVTFGLGATGEAGPLTVHWPDGSTQTVDIPAVDVTLTVRQEP